MGSISIKVEGDTTKLLQRLRNLSGIDRKALNQVLGEAVRTSTLERFKQQKSPDEQKWRQSMRASASGGMTLTDSGNLRRKIFSTASEDGFAVGTDVVYAATHQFGDKKRKITAKTTRGLRFKQNGTWVCKREVIVDIPERPFLGINQDDIKEIKATLDEVFMEE